MSTNPAVSARLALLENNVVMSGETPDTLRQIDAEVSACAMRLAQLCQRGDHDVGQLIAALDALRTAGTAARSAVLLRCVAN